MLGTSHVLQDRRAAKLKEKEEYLTAKMSDTKIHSPCFSTDASNDYDPKRSSDSKRQSRLSVVRASFSIKNAP
jgi:hypothetical protein